MSASISEGGDKEYSVERYRGTQLVQGVRDQAADALVHTNA